jgi:hypothetical protein
MLAGERFSDRPASVCPILAAILRAYNDNVDRRRRPDLYRYASEAVGTRGDFALELRRARTAIAWATDQFERRRPRLLRRIPPAPTPGDGPDQIAFYLLKAVGRRRSDQTHLALLALIDRLIAIDAEPHNETAAWFVSPRELEAELLEPPVFALSF